MKSAAKPYMNPYLAGVCLGLVLLASFLILGAGLGASSGLARIGGLIINGTKSYAKGSFVLRWASPGPKADRLLRSE